MEAILQKKVGRLIIAFSITVCFVVLTITQLFVGTDSLYSQSDTRLIENNVSSRGSIENTESLLSWEAVIYISDADNANDSIFIGTDPTATNGLDNHLGEFELPPVPPSGVFDSRLILPTTPSIPSKRDYRNDTNQSINWRMTFQPATSYPMTFTWDPSELGPGNFMLKDEIIGTFITVNMKTQSSYTLTNTGITSLKIEYTQFSAPNLISPLNNSIGIPLEPTLNWSAVNGAVSYGVEISTNQNFSTLVYSSSVSTNSVTIPAGTLQAITEYYWRVNANDGSSTSGYSATWKFETACPITWDAFIKLTDSGGFKDSLLFGTSPAGTNGLDFCLDEEEIPPVPPTGVFDFRFILPISSPVASKIDYRSDTNQTINWRMTFQPESGYPMTFSWDPSLLPSGSFKLRDEVTGSIINVNMKSQSSYTLTNTGIMSLKIEYAQTITVPVNVFAHWNIVSVPVLAADMSASTLFPGATTPTFGFSNGYINTSTLLNGKGYFVRFANSQTIDIVGTNISPKEISVPSGWSMIGPFETNVSVSSIISNPPGLVITSYFGYNSGYTSSTTLEPGKGYWIKTTQAGTLILPDLLDNIPENVVSADEDRSSWTTLRLKESNGSGEMELYLAKPDELTSSSYELPPVPPHGIFDVRYASNNYAEPIGMNHTIKINSTEYPVEIRAENLNGLVLRVRDKVTGEIVNAQLTEGVSIMIPHPIEMLDIIIENSIPTEYSLSQNYPNPFNPVTKIHYAIPHEGMVTLQVYDITGREVTKLVNETKSAGYYHVDFDASGLSSGVYFYRIHSGSYSNVKRMLLLK